MKKQKVLFVIDTKRVAATEVSVLTRIAALKKIDIDSLVVVTQESKFTDLLDRSHVDYQVIDSSKIEKKGVFGFLSEGGELKSIIQKNQVTILHCIDLKLASYSIKGARQSHVPCIIHLHSLPKKSDLKDNANIAKANMVLASSEYIRQFVINILGFNRKKIRTLYDGIVDAKVDSRATQLEEYRKKYKIKEDTKVIGQMGNIAPHKGLDYFVKMAQIVKKSAPNTKFMIIGKAMEEYKANLMQLIDECQLNDDVIISNEEDNLYDLLNTLDVSVLASINEGLGRSLIESLALGKPVIGTKVGAQSEVISDEKTGYLVEPKNENELAEKVLYFLKRPSLAKRMAESGQKFVMDTFSVDKQAKECSKIYQELVKA